MEPLQRRMPKGGMSRSSPSLAAAFNLRQYSLDRKHIAAGSPSNQSRSQPLLEGIDLVGGNGRWRQRKAKEEWERRAVEDAERTRHQKIVEEERRRRLAELDAKRRRLEEEEHQRRREERDRQLQEQRDVEERRRAHEEQVRVRREEEEKDWLARQPKTCETCSGSGKCMKCSGKGHFFAMFLVSTVNSETTTDFGRHSQGCEDCGGYKHNLLGDLKTGSGNCNACGGLGKITPKIPIKAPRRRSMGRDALELGFLHSPSAGSSPKAPISP